MLHNLYLYIKAIRVWQWFKNLVVFTLPIGSGAMDFQILIKSLWAFLGLSFISSSIYLINDIKDIDIDSQHYMKKNRPISSGLISIQSAKIFSCLLFLLSIFIFSSLNLTSLVLGCSYFLVGVLYTFKLKFTAYFDVLTISSLFLIRVLIGGYSVEINPSSILLLFIFFSSLSLAISKRISIIKDDRLPVDSLYKNFLCNSFEINKTNNIFKATLILSFSTYTFWVFFVNITELFTFAAVFSILSIFFLGRSLLGIYKLTNISELEDFLISIYKNKKELSFIFFTILFSLLGIYLNL